jgi:hypothetical protein
LAAVYGLFNVEVLVAVVGVSSRRYRPHSLSEASPDDYLLAFGLEAG